ncbi:SDR family oxidoreductase [Hyphomonas sp.]|uniref:SDR family oxidoreductase n=1 Tax=Hyphomonas sp. TaxID=87 RepID=UPI003F6E7D8F
MTDSRPHAGKTVLITGASSGINLGIARHMGGLGARIAILSRDQARIGKAAADLSNAGVDVLAYAADVRDPERLSEVAETIGAEWGPLDTLVCGAAGNFFASASEMSPNAFRTIVEIDLIGTFNAMKAAYPLLRRPGANIISITAPQAQRPMKKQSHVCAAKAGIDMLTRCLAMEWGPEGIRVNAISPGPVADTEGFTRLAPDAVRKNEVRQALAVPRLGTTRDIAQAVAWLSSDEASFVTGSILSCDGGMVLGNLIPPD